jgi:hypothetical protein
VLIAGQGRIADNPIALNAGWDETMLAAELARLREDGVVRSDLAKSASSPAVN